MTKRITLSTKMIERKTRARRYYPVGSSFTRKTRRRKNRLTSGPSRLIRFGSLKPFERQKIQICYFPSIDEESYGKDGERKTEVS